MSGGMSNKISNVLGVPIPSPLAQQLQVRSRKNVGGSQSDNFYRDNDNLVYLANKTSWVRLFSSVNVKGEDLDYFKNNFGLALTDPTDLAKQFVLFGGTSQFSKSANQEGQYNFRAGLRKTNGAYGILGDKEISDYGYRPMPGITDASIETQGRLGSIRMATINFKVWDKYQLDVMDALYFKLGYTMFLEWGHTVYYDNNEKLQKSEFHQIDPFEPALKKEQIVRKIAENIKKTDGNYDAMLGMCTNFNFSYNQEGGYDCTIKLIALGALADSTKLNQTQAFPKIYSNVIKSFVNTLRRIEQARLDKIAAEEKAKAAAATATTENQKSAPKKNQTIQEFFAAKYPSSNFSDGLLLPYNSNDKNKATFVFGDYDQRDPAVGQSIYPMNLGLGIHGNRDKNKTLYSSYTINTDIIRDCLFSISQNGGSLNNAVFKRNKEGGKGISWDYNSYSKSDDVEILHYLKSSNGTIYPFRINFEIETATVNSGLSEYWRKWDNDSKESGTFHYIMHVLFEFYKKGGEIKKTNWDEISLYNVSKTPKTTQLTYHGTNDKVVYTIPSAPNKNNFEIQVTLNIDYKTNTQRTEEITDSAGNKSTRNVPGEYETKTLPITFTFYDSSIIKSLELTPEGARDPFKNYTDNISAQNSTPPPAPEPEPKPTVASVTEEESMKYHSGLEYLIRSIQLYGLTKFLNSDKQLRVQEIDLYEKGGKDSFIVQAFSNGVLSSIIDNLGKDPKQYVNIDHTKLDRQKLMYAYASYGFNHNLMGTSDNDIEVPQVNFKDLFKAWVVPYKVNGGVTSQTDVNHPVYIKLGLLIMILNHMCTIYDSEEGETVTTDKQVPLLYIDFNTETNICLSEPLQMSTDVFKFLIPFRGTNEEYSSLFDDAILKKDSKTGKIYTGEGTDEDPMEEIFKPKPEDVLSAQLPNFKDPEGGDMSAYRGLIMNALVNTDYILNLCKNMASNNESQAVYLKPFLQQLITDLNKSLGDINLFRIAYSDTGNCLYITDDQICPPHANENTYLRAEINSQPNYTLPLYGVNSIAKSISINTEVSSRLANMIAISSNSNQTSDAGKDGSPFGHMNKNYTDRYKVQTLTANASSGVSKDKYKKLKAAGKTEDEIIKVLGADVVAQLKAEDNQKKDAKKGDMSAAKMFNHFVRSCLSTDSPSQDDVSSATNYYIERMNKRKSQNPGTKSSAMIPVSVEFKTDGLAGLAMGHAFVLPDQLLPNTYSNSFGRGKDKQDNRRIGFVVIGLNHSLQSNLWETTVKANMIYLKDPTDYVTTGFNTDKELSQGDFIGTPEENDTDTDYSKTPNSSNYPSTPSAYPNVKFANIGLGNPAGDKINPKLLQDVSDAAVKSGVTVTITTAVSGHHTNPPSRHTPGNAVDIAIIDGISVSKTATNISKIKEFTQTLLDMGYAKNAEGPNKKAVLTFDFPKHGDHVHVSNKT
jgi:hypothetical protein